MTNYFYTTDPAVVFYNADYYLNLPEHAKPISETDHENLMQGQSQGKRISCNANGDLYLTTPEIVFPPPQRTFTSLEFMAKFTSVEKLKVSQLAMKDVNIFQWYMTMIGATYIDLDDPLTVEGLEFLVTNGIISEQRKEEILT